ncbi:restriction endonuclease [Bacillus mycoides]|uniref:restriction endonuclease n=1 Tax=Bacillus mycoides TaxID=1405 RepID=UPI003D65AE44
MFEILIITLLIMLLIGFFVKRKQKKENKINMQKLAELKALEIQKAAKLKALEMQKRLEMRQSHIDAIDLMKGRQFEQYLNVIFQELGYESQVTKGSGDFGADLILKSNNETIIVQAKRHRNKVSLQAVQEVVAARGYYNANHAWVVTNNYFTESAQELANANDVLLLDRNRLIKLSEQANRHPSAVGSSS